MEQEVYKPKLRITTLSENGTPLSDRLVDAYTEMNSGPKVQHNDDIPNKMSNLSTRWVRPAI
jgi:hypothetical protein